MTPAQPVPFTGTGAVRATHTVVRGYLVHETAGAAARVHIYDNASAASGTLLGAATLAANGHVDVDIPGGVWAANGVYVDVVAGDVAGHIRI